MILSIIDMEYTAVDRQFCFKLFSVPLLFRFYLDSVCSCFIVHSSLMHFPLFFCSGFFPVAVNFLRRMPVIGQLLNLPFISGVSITYFGIRQIDVA